ncbi:cwf18 pre-mRNA splicing factor-domain-containing protein [Tuber borchii]|uniref:Cwf18 pre-mRNA splicing factor-domain-containing protein n=1 Tax=Tuber borchii TaxID=42251 RepID=A0A2T7A9G8_TUBBO|nr:cwf18 pre-mRNA splicing factor-domain-containing protein [Tuber borchii]
MSSIASLDAQSAARKERLAQLKSLKRKQPPADPSPSQEVTMTMDDPENPEKGTNVHLSGRNYDIESRAPKMGFVSAPSEGQETLEDAAKKIVETTKALQIEDEKNDKPIDLFNLQPKKPNWDLKRDADKKLEKLNQKTDIAIAKIIRARIEEARQKRIGHSKGGDETEDVEGSVASIAPMLRTPMAMRQILHDATKEWVAQRE